MNFNLNIDLVTKKSLIQKCRDMNIKGYTKLTKEELVELFQIIKELEQMTKNNNKRDNKYKELYREVYNEEYD